MKSVTLCLCALLCIATAKVIDMNQVVDSYLAFVNEVLVETQTVVHQIPPWQWSGGSHTGGELYALDSLYRTAPCSFDIEDNIAKTEYHIGLSLLSIFLPQLTIGDDSMTALTKFGDNSLIFQTTTVMSPPPDCKVTVDQFSVENLKNIILYSSLPQYDGEDITELFVDNVLPTINDYLDQLRPQLSEYYTYVTCGPPSYLAKNVTSLNMLASFLKIK